jgi:pre-rRNA-processing protein TSR3
MSTVLIPSTTIIRHRKENLKKCSLRGLETHPSMQFFKYPGATALSPNALLLTIDGEPLTPLDRGRELILIDGTWNLAKKMLKNIAGLQALERRSLPGEWKTAYPRVQTGCEDPARGLASVEALYAAYAVMGFDCPELLSGYYFKDAFIQLNLDLIQSLIRFAPNS